MNPEPEGIDIHAHGVPPQFLEEVRRTRLGGVEVDLADGRYQVTFPGREPLRPVAGNMIDFRRRLHWLDTQGMREQLIAPWLDVAGQELGARDGAVWARQLNDAFAAVVSDSGGRLRAHAMLHLADPEAAAAELERCVTELGMTGCMLPTNVPAGALWERRYDAVWEAAQALSVPVVLHPPTDAPSGVLFKEFPKLRGLHGRLIDTTILATQLIMTGVFDRFDRLHLVLVHGGGFLPYQTGRLDRMLGAKDGTPPSALLERFSYDTVLLSPAAVGLLLDVAGPELVMIGSDYGAGAKDKGGPVLTEALDAAGVDPAARAMVVRGNAERAFRIAEPAARR